jgi:DNA-binding LytR/AlgR family response regulator
VALSGRGHYVRVRTRAGEVELLMRMADAVAETAGVAGLRVHRSHWVATTEVRAVRRRGPGAVLTMSAGPDVPVSRAGLRDLRAAGLWADGDREPVGLRGRADG